MGESKPKDSVDIKVVKGTRGRNPLGAIDGCPCLVCIEVDRCSRTGNISPLTCPKIREWIIVKNRSH